MAEWVAISKDIDKTNGELLGATYVMKVPGGMIVRNIMNFGVGMVFVPDPSPQMTVNFENVLEKWIENNSI